jgi:hypothetical protein
MNRLQKGEFRIAVVGSAILIMETLFKSNG